jgi:hypothetical protein
MPDGPRYEDDFYAWTQYQAQVLRSMECDDQRFDRENLADEIEARGRTELQHVWVLVRRIVTHFLLLAHGPSSGSWYGWMREVVEARIELGDKMSPSIWRLTDAELPELYHDGREVAELRLRGLGDVTSAGCLPILSAYSLADICRDEWYPAAPEEPK